MGDDAIDRSSRRRVLQSASVVLGAGLAGCGGSAGDGGGATPAGTAGTPTATAATPTRTPDRPSIERQTILRDKAAVTHVRRAVTGEIVWPSFESYNVVDPELLGVWENGEYAFRFTDDNEFVDSGPDGETGGTYAAAEGVLYLQYESGEEVTAGYEIAERNGEVVVTFRSQDGEEVRFRRTTDGSDDRSVVQVFEDVVLVEADDPTTQGGDVETGSAGSGFVVSPDGYVVTNAHVVGTHQNPEETLYLRLALRTQQEVRGTLESDYDLSESQRQKAEDVLLDKLFSYFAEHSQIRGVETNVGVLHGRATPEDDVEVKSWPASVETSGTVREEVSGEPSWGRDVAVLKVDDQEPLPTVPLGSSTDLGTGEKLFVVGYPAMSTEEYFKDRETTLEPTLTSGVVSAVRTLNSGVSAIQTDAGINNGNSGGPMYNADGEVVGIATFKPPELDVQEISFGLPIEVATGFMDELGVENEPGELTTAYREGLEAYWRGDCDAASEKMDAVLDLWPEHPYAGTVVEDC